MLICVKVYSKCAFEYNSDTEYPEMQACRNEIYCLLLNLYVSFCQVGVIDFSLYLKDVQDLNGGKE